MLPTRWDPFRELSTFHREIDDFFRRTFGLARGETEEGIFSPVVNSYLKGETYCIEVEIPGVDKKDLDVSIEGNVLTIRGERKMSHEVKEEKFFHRESRFPASLLLRNICIGSSASDEKRERFPRSPFSRTCGVSPEGTGSGRLAIRC